MPPSSNNSLVVYLNRLDVDTILAGVNKMSFFPDLPGFSFSVLSKTRPYQADEIVGALKLAGSIGTDEDNYDEMTLKQWFVHKPTRVTLPDGSRPQKYMMLYHPSSEEKQVDAFSPESLFDPPTKFFWLPIEHYEFVDVWYSTEMENLFKPALEEGQTAREKAEELLKVFKQAIKDPTLKSMRNLIDDFDNNKWLDSDALAGVISPDGSKWESLPIQPTDDDFVKAIFRFQKIIQYMVIALELALDCNLETGKTLVWEKECCAEAIEAVNKVANTHVICDKSGSTLAKYFRLFRDNDFKFPNPLLHQHKYGPYFLVNNPKYAKLLREWASDNLREVSCKSFRERFMDVILPMLVAEKKKESPLSSEDFQRLSEIELDEDEEFDLLLFSDEDKDECYKKSILGRWHLKSSFVKRLLATGCTFLASAATSSRRVASPTFTTTQRTSRIISSTATTISRIMNIALHVG